MLPIVSLSLDELPNENHITAVERANRMAGARLRKEENNKIYKVIMDWLEAHGVPCYLDMHYKRTPRSNPEQIYRATMPVLTSQQVRVLVQVQKNRDADNNSMKALFDAITKANLWRDDKQVTKLHIEKDTEGKFDHVEVHIFDNWIG